MTEKTVLLVEDNADDVELTLRLFHKHDAARKIDVARNGAEALDYLFCRGAYAARTPLPPALILLDLKLPKVDGLEVLQQIRAHVETRLIPVVMLTTSNEEKDKVASYALGANSYIQKSLNFDDFTETIRRVGDYWLSLNEAPSSTPKT